MSGWMEEAEEVQSQKKSGWMEEALDLSNDDFGEALLTSLGDTITMNAGPKIDAGITTGLGKLGSVLGLNDDTRSLKDRYAEHLKQQIQRRAKLSEKHYSGSMLGRGAGYAVTAPKSLIGATVQGLVRDAGGSEGETLGDVASDALQGAKSMATGYATGSALGFPGKILKKLSPQNTATVVGGATKMIPGVGNKMSPHVRNTVKNYLMKKQGGAVGQTFQSSGGLFGKPPAPPSQPVLPKVGAAVGADMTAPDYFMQWHKSQKTRESQ